MISKKMLLNAVLVVLLASMAATALQTQAATITVTSNSDSGPGSLRQAIVDAVSGDEIVFDPDVGFIQLASELIVDENLTITGGGQGTTIIDGDHSSRIFRILGATVTISNMTIQNGRALEASPGNAFGGGIWTSGTLTLDHCTVKNNTAFDETPPFDDSHGGGIFNNHGTLSLNHCTVSGNTADSYGGGISFFGGTLTVNNSVISGNSVIQFGGGIASGLFVFPATVTVNDSTVTNNTNSQGQGGGIYVFDATLTLNNSTVSNNTDDTADSFAAAIAFFNNNPAIMTLNNSTISGNNTRGIAASGNTGGLGTLTLNNSTIAGNDLGGIRVFSHSETTLKNSLVANANDDCRLDGGIIISDGYNLDSDDTCGLDQPTDLPRTDPVLGPLQDNGGPTETHALLLGSPAVDAGSCPGVTTDQRGLPRPVDTPSVPNVDDGCDIGAFESQWPLLVVLESFTAEVTRRGVLVKWKTAMEIDNIGFRILRSREGKEPVVITPQLIPARGTELSGAEYEYLDSDRQEPGTVTYGLEDIDVHGRVTKAGNAMPVEITRPIGLSRPRLGDRPTRRPRKR